MATAKGFEEKGVEHGMLQLHLYGVLVAQVDESGWMLYTPYEEVFDIMGDIADARKRITEVQYPEGSEPIQTEGQSFGPTLS